MQFYRVSWFRLRCVRAFVCLDLEGCGTSIAVSAGNRAARQLIRKHCAFRVHLMHKLFHVLVPLKRKLRQYYAYTFVHGAQCVIVNCLKWYERKHVALTGFLVINEFSFTAVYWFIFVCEKQGGESYEVINLLKPNDIYICRAAALTSRRYILNIYSTNIHTEYLKHAA